jgi:hypothetical protein
MGQKISGVRRFIALRDVGLFRRTARCATVHLAVRQMPPFSISAVRIFKCVPTGADFDYYIRSILMRTRDTRRELERPTALRNFGRPRAGQSYGGCCVGRHNHDEFEGMAVPAPFRTDAAIRRHMARARVRQPAAGLRLNQNMFITGMRRIDVDAADDFVHPFAYRAICIVIEGIHFLVFERAVGLYAVPSLPNGRGPLFDRIQP